MHSPPNRLQAKITHTSAVKFSRNLFCETSTLKYPWSRENNVEKVRNLSIRYIKLNGAEPVAETSPNLISIRAESFGALSKLVWSDSLSALLCSLRLTRRLFGWLYPFLLLPFFLAELYWAIVLSLVFIPPFSGYDIKSNFDWWHTFHSKFVKYFRLMCSQSSEKM